MAPFNGSQRQRKAVRNKKRGVVDHVHDLPCAGSGRSFLIVLDHVGSWAHGSFCDQAHSLADGRLGLPRASVIPNIRLRLEKDILPAARERKNSSNPQSLL